MVLPLKIYDDCELCAGTGTYEGVTDWGLEWIACIACIERHIAEMYKELYDIWVRETEENDVRLQNLL